MASTEPIADEMDEGDGRKRGYSVVMNCYEDGSHDVFKTALQPASEMDHPDGLFGLESLEGALKGVIAVKQGPGFETPGHAALMEEYHG